MLRRLQDFLQLPEVGSIRPEVAPVQPKTTATSGGTEPTTVSATSDPHRSPIDVTVNGSAEASHDGGSAEVNQPGQPDGFVVRVDHCNFAWEAGVPVLSDLTLHLRRGEMITIGWIATYCCR